LISLTLVSCSNSPEVTSPGKAAERLATDLGAKLDQTGLAGKLAASQSVLQPWHAWDAGAGRTSLETLAGDKIEVSLTYWSGTLWTTLRAAASGDGYCLAVAAVQDDPIAWWVKASGTRNGKIADEAACAAVAPS
jgi:hypothetical protein